MEEVIKKDELLSEYDSEKNPDFFRFFLSIISLTLIIFLLGVYYFKPFSELEFSAKPLNHNFSIADSFKKMQFYDNMRFPDRRITYHIDKNCSLKKKQDMRDAFKIIENLTSLEFVELNTDFRDAEISVTCNETIRYYRKRMFIAGEGGPTHVVRAGNFNVILSGTILLIKNSECEKPNVAIHELLHVLGFTHSENPNNIMYNFTKCSQVIGDDSIKLIDSLYSVESLPDLVFEEGNTSVFMHSRYLDINMSLRNNGLKKASESMIEIIVDGKKIKEISIGEIEIGNGKAITIQNIWVAKLNPEKIELFIKADFSELDKKNNRIYFEVKE